MSKPAIAFSLTLLLFIACTERNNTAIKENKAIAAIPQQPIAISQDSGIKTIHIFVALCDNKYQAIVPVPASIGNGQNEKTNLYWGAGYGVKSFFTTKSKDWKLISSITKPAANILERIFLKHVSKNIYLVADAYDGKFIKQTTIDFLNAAAGKNEIAMEAGNKKIYFGGLADLVAYVGHDGLMDFSLEQKFEKATSKKREAIMLACYSRYFFTPHLKQTGATPILWTNGLMAPEAYTLHDAIHVWIENKPTAEVALAGAMAYSKYQKCSLKAAKNLLVEGW